MNDQNINLLLVEDQEDFACVIRDVLEGAGGQSFAVTHVNRLEAAREKLAESPFDALLLDLNLPDSRGLNTCSAAQAAAPAMPIVVLTGVDDETVAHQA